jgi:two-component system KDP operon response regulator KdpE
LNQHPATILVVDDEAPLRRFLRATLTDRGYRVVEAENAADGLAAAADQAPDVVLLDLGLPDMDGLTVIRRLREWLTAPIVVISARGQERDKVDALDAGADDYLTKPFGVAELHARLRVALRHYSRGGAAGAAQAERLTVGELVVDFAARRVFVGEQEAHLTKLEFNLLAALARHPGKVLTHTQLLREVWGPHAAGETHYLRVYAANLRRKLEPDPAQPRYLITEQGVGYRLADE